MANMNLNNFGVLRGRIITTDIPKHTFFNKDGSAKIMLTIAPKRNYRSADQKDDDRIPVQIFVPKESVTVNPDGTHTIKRWGNIGTGDALLLQVHIEENTYKKQDGEMVYGAPVIRVDDFQFDETKAEKEARLASKVVAGN